MNPPWTSIVSREGESEEGGAAQRVPTYFVLVLVRGTQYGAQVGKERKWWSEGKIWSREGRTAIIPVQTNQVKICCMARGLENPHGARAEGNAHVKKGGSKRLLGEGGVYKREEVTSSLAAVHKRGRGKEGGSTGSPNLCMEERVGFARTDGYGT